MQRRANRRTQARERLREALDLARKLGAGAIAEHAQGELRAAGGRLRRYAISGLDALTGSERRVAELATEGLSNKEIAQSLFVSLRTVETHLTSVYRKLGCRGRDELSAALGLGADPRPESAQSPQRGSP